MVEIITLVQVVSLRLEWAAWHLPQGLYRGNRCVRLSRKRGRIWTTIREGVSKWSEDAEAEGLGQGRWGQTAKTEHSGEDVTEIGGHGLGVEVKRTRAQSKAQHWHTNHWGNPISRHEVSPVMLLFGVPRACWPGCAGSLELQCHVGHRTLILQQLRT